MDTIRGHHLVLLQYDDAANAELYEHRMQVLRLWPEFVSHPIFSDLDTI